MTLIRIAIFTFVFALTELVLAQSYCVTKSGAKLRKSANAKAALSWQVGKYMPLMGTGRKQGSWIEVRDVDNQVHWVSSSDVTTKKTCVVVRVKNTRLRAGPGSEFQASPLGVADKYMAFADLGGEDGWTQVTDDDGATAWMNIDHAWKPTKKARVSFDRN